MARKPAPSLTDITLKKGDGRPAVGAPQRGADIPAPSPAPKARREPGTDPLVPLNFRVPASLKAEIEEFAFMSRPRRKLVDVLKDGFAALKEKEGMK